MTKRDMEMLDLQKCRIQFASPEGAYEGIVHVVCTVSQKILVSKIVFLPKRTPMGTLNFKFREILSYKVLSRPDPSDVNKAKPTTPSYTYAPTRGKDTCFIDDLSEAGDLESNDDVCIDDLYEEEAYELKVPPMLSGRIPTDNVVIDCIDDEFHQAVKHIFQQDCIGVTLEGPKIGRNGKLSWLGMATSSCTFLFDIESLGKAAFKEGLKKILENPNIEKVFHDCRQASDCLFHEYSTRLVNVFDTQVADLLVTMQRSQTTKFNKRVSPIDSCLRTYLEIPEDFIHKPKSFHSYEDEVNYSRLRPLQSDRRDVVLKNVMYLRLLKRELNLAMLTPFRRAVEIYLQVLQTASDRELLLDPSIPEELPQELVLEGVQIVRFNEFVEVPPVVASGPPYQNLKNPVRSYADYCKKIEKRQGSNLSGNGTEFPTNANEGNGSGKSIADIMSTSLHNATQLLEQPQIVENGASFHHLLYQNVPSSNKTSKIDKSTVKKTVLRNSFSPPKEVCEKVDTTNPSLSGKPKVSALSQYWNSIARLRMNQSTDSETCPSTNSSDSEAELCKPPKKTVLQSSFSPQKEVSEDLPFISVCDVTVEPSILHLQRHRFNRSTDSSDSCTESSSDGVDSSDDDPWAALRAAFSSDCCAANVKTNYRFVPA